VVAGLPHAVATMAATAPSSANRPIDETRNIEPLLITP
jgi:hypothetical protein